MVIYNTISNLSKLPLEYFTSLAISHLTNLNIIADKQENKNTLSKTDNFESLVQMVSFDEIVVEWTE
jgi:hypothetical protein